MTLTNQCRFIAPASRQASEFAHFPQETGRRVIDEVFRRIKEPGSWVALYNVETHPAYREFLAEVISCVRPLVDPKQPGTHNVGGFIFISAPPSVTPFHIDRENNFWLQIKGRKVLNVWDHTDRQAVAAEAVEHFIVHAGLEGVRLKDGLQLRSHEFDVGPGDGVYFPSTSPHTTHTDPAWARPGDGVSISISVVFYTNVTRRTANVHAWNLFLRRLGMQPTEPGQSIWLDRMRSNLHLGQGDLSRLSAAGESLEKRCSIRPRWHAPCMRRGIDSRDPSHEPTQLCQRRIHDD